MESSPPDATLRAGGGLHEDTPQQILQEEVHLHVSASEISNATGIAAYDFGIISHGLPGGMLSTGSTPCSQADGVNQGQLAAHHFQTMQSMHDYAGYPYSRAGAVHWYQDTGVGMHAPTNVTSFAEGNSATSQEEMWDIPTIHPSCGSISNGITCPHHGNLGCMRPHAQGTTLQHIPFWSTDTSDFGHGAVICELTEDSMELNSTPSVVAHPVGQTDPRSSVNGLSMIDSNYDIDSSNASTPTTSMTSPTSTYST